MHVKSAILKPLPLLLAALLTIATLEGCRSQRLLHRNDKTETNAATEHHDTPEEPAPSDAVALNSVHSYSANFQCTVEGVKVSGQIRLVHDSIIWISVSKVVELGRAVMTPSGIKAYANIINKYYDGDYATLANRFGIDIDFATAEALLLGNLPPDCNKTKTAQHDGQNTTLTFQQTSKATGNQRQVTITKENTGNRIARIEIVSNMPSQKLASSYTETTRVGDKQLPSTFDVQLASRRVDVSTRVTAGNIQTERKMTFPFSIPSRCREL